MSRFRLLIVLGALTCWLPTAAWSADYKLLDGTVLAGTVIDGRAQGVVIMTPDNKPLPRMPWNKFSQEALKEFLKDRKLKQFVELLIDEPEAGGAELAMPAIQRQPKPEIKFKEVERLDRYPKKPGLMGSIFSTAAGWLMILLFIGANLYAGYEVAIYRRRPVKLVLAASLVPIIGPVVFLCMPTINKQAEAAAQKAQADAAAAAAAEAEAQAAAAAAAATPDAGMETIAPPPPSYPPTVYLRRGEVTFNRRFIETKLAPFFKLVPGEKEKDLMLIFHTTGGSFIGKRVNKVTQTDLTVVVQKEGAFCDQDVTINDIREIHIRHKDAPEE